MIFATRNNEGVISKHKTVEQAIQAFLSEEGYRLDFLLDDESVLHVFRDEFQEDEGPLPGYSKADSKLVAFIPTKKVDSIVDNVISVDFTK